MFKDKIISFINNFYLKKIIGMFIMKLKRYLIISILFMLLLCCVGSIYAVSDDDMNNTMGEMDSNSESIIEIDDLSINDEEIDDTDPVLSIQDTNTDANDTDSVLSMQDANVAANDTNTDANDTDSVLSMQDMDSMDVNADDSSPAPKLQSNNNKNLVGVYDSGSVVGVKNSEGTAVLKASAWGSLTELQQLINRAAKGSVVRLTKSYKFMKGDSSDGVMISKNLILMGKKNCQINGMWKSRLLRINSKCTVKIAGIHFKNGYTSGSNGAGIFIKNGANVIIRNCIFNTNKIHNANGGGIFTDERVKLTIIKSKFVGNRAIRVSNLPWGQFKRGQGSAIVASPGNLLRIYTTNFQNNNAYSSTVLVVSYDDSKVLTSTAMVTGCRFVNNVARSHTAFYLDEFGKGQFSKCVFKNNRATEHGPILMFEATKYGKLSKCQFIKNKAFGGIVCLGEFDEDGLYGVAKVTVIGSSFKYNIADYGGAISSNSAHLTVSSSTFVGNKANKCGGAIYTNEYGSLKLYSSKFYKNSAGEYGGGISSGISNAYAYNCKFYCNVAGLGGQNVFGEAERSIVVPTPCIAILPETTVGYQSTEAVYGSLKYNGVNKLIPYGYLKLYANYQNEYDFTYTTVSDASGHFKVFTKNLSRGTYYITITSDDSLITMPTLRTVIHVV